MRSHAVIVPWMNASSRPIQTFCSANDWSSVESVDTSPSHGSSPKTGYLPANSELFYSRVYRWLEEYLKQPRPETVVNMKLDYLDTSSSKHFFNIFDRLNAVNERGRTVHVNWHYESGDEEMAETGKDYQSFFSLDFKFIEVRELF